MQAIEFNTEIHDGTIQVPSHHGDWLKEKVRVIVLAAEDESAPRPVIEPSVRRQSPSREAYGRCSVTTLKGMVRRKRHPIGIEEMNLAIAAQGARAR
uniref:Uncharacterized protein n=1 Tax=Candidatus Kentrum sp. LFY TaxID=2126342 RepID=A0A450UDB3_9GAMM|nr:MAG: hypothetical protein BECKLFY1418B_GA0070995_101945 [Candidatus Kentron sp. LFY]VFJ97771.1 MAG: hypothetical protein BECKLFY1418A_GA0070994_107315 [Candidatus Kentron sp. LFY]VFK17371.1 MAG: hypothetical protein BECKLFY1418C_GA0070996_103116 [Candidatus Kentron sp. LFY]